MTFTQSISTCFSKYADFNGRARRSEYWWFYLFYFLIAWAAMMVGWASHTGYALNWLVKLALLLPSLAVCARRLHDTGRSGWWMLIAFTIIGIIPLVIWLATEGEKKDNQFGGDPKATAV